MVARRWDKSCEIISNKRICSDYFELKIKSPLFAGKCVPGQFFMITVPGVFLRRPISVHDCRKNYVTFLYKVAGKGTKILSEIKNGEIALLGPLGNGYDLKLPKNSAPVIVAGGTGIASVHFLAVKLKRSGTLFYGAGSKKDLLCLGQFKKLGWKTVLATDDGSKGHKGFVTEILEKEITNYELRITNKKTAIKPILYACGPAPMLKKVLKIARDRGVKGYVSLEEKMACGIGNCQGCAVKINGVNKMTCKDGPVFKIEEAEL